MRRVDYSVNASADRSRIDAFLRSWIEDVVKPSMRSATSISYRAAVEGHIIPRIGAMRLERLTPVEVQRFYTELRDDGIGARTRQKVHAVLHRALASAVRSQLIATNPAELDDDAPKYRAPEREPLTLEQAKTLLDAAKGDRFEALYVLALTTGARQGELFALRWSDVDLAAGAISIRRTVQDADSGSRLQTGQTKTTASRRRIALSTLAIAALSKHRQRGTNLRPSDLVFAAQNGELLRRQNFLRREFYPLLDRAELPRIHFHDLRHTAATLSAAMGVPVVMVAQMLGHVDPTITLRTYQHAFEGGSGDASRRLGDLLGAKPKRGR